MRDNATGDLAWNFTEVKRVSGLQREWDAQRSRTARLDRELELARPHMPALSDSWLEARRAVYAARTRRLLDTCRRHQVGIRVGNVTSRPAPAPLESINPAHFVEAPALNATICLVPKVASTSLLSTILRVTGVGVPVFGDNTTSLHAMTLLLVRHPLRRLVSAYRDKVERASPRPSLRVQRAGILRRYEQLRFGGGGGGRYRRDVVRRRGVPSFAEFLTAVLLGAQPLRDPHWEPVWRRCAPCHVGYQIIAQLETAADDLPFVWNALKLYPWARIPWLHRTRPAGEPPLRELADRYLRPLERELVAALRAEYRLDFDLFGYDWPGLMRMSGHCPPAAADCDLL
ncbi:carbohydrate sulfotransferase 13-like [Pollicipes pollicipes]|uniref:carbohydrate sulfotransferase 13-like n=1 Tax=Pollicipes pollicipes TaxID=41117 RepID=UPI001884C143|nr:carbohydrate sulfotransferase 13-like [Pollicipes pollicipes]